MAVATTRPHPPARPHGPLREVLPGLWFVTGTVAMNVPLPLRFSRAMTAVVADGRVILVNSVRLDDAGLARLEQLGRVTDVIRLAGNHGSDDAFYQQRFAARVWAAAGAPYVPGFDLRATPYFTADASFDATTELPIAGARVRMIGSTPPEAVLWLPQHGGTVIAGDSLQNWAAPDRYFNWIGRFMMRRMGFLRPFNVGPAWLGRCKPPATDLRAIAALAYANLLPAHGEPVLGDAATKFRPALERAASKREAEG